jgi:histidinol phosphatase-like enzyme (inositol monophosphatase family)
MLQAPVEALFMNTTPYFEFIESVVNATAEVIRPLYGNLELEIETKSDQTPVTIADRRAEEVLREHIQREFPTHGIVGEEYGSENEDAEFVWMLDPIDGTKTFATACPLFGTLIALLYQGQPVVGAIHQPILDQLCIGDSEKTLYNGRHVRMRETDSLDQATLLTTDVHAVARYQSEKPFWALSREVKLFRTWGDCYGYLLLATGWADIMLDPVVNPWDVMPLIPIIQGAGGIITTWDGESAVRATSCVAASKSLHAVVLERLRA